jgi:hypothetical protein
MTFSTELPIDFKFNHLQFFELLTDCNVRLLYVIEVESGGWIYYFVRANFSNTYFVLEVDDELCHLYIDPFASMDDHRFFPYLVDTLLHYLGNGNRLQGKNPFKLFDEEWIEEHIAEGVAYLKCCLSLSTFYWIEAYIGGYVAISTEYLAQYGVSIYSSTPRIYGYISYLMRNRKIKIAPIELVDKFYEEGVNDEEIDVEVPQHISIAKVKSWQIDGEETYDSFSQEDVDLLLKLADSYEKGENLDPVVLNDIGTLFQEGVGVSVDGEKAVYWYRQAIKQGEKYYAPVNLGDIYRKGCGAVAISLKEAYEAFLLSDDPYAYYRIGQAFEEGWLGEVNPETAMKWYEKSANCGHHLALKRLGKSKNSSKI